MTPAETAQLVEVNQQLVLTTIRANAAEEALKEAGRHKDEFLAMLGHELRNPLAPIRTAAEVLSVIANGDTKLIWIHDVLVRQVGHLTRLVDDLSEISLIARGKIRIRLEPVDVCAVVAQSLGRAQPSIASRQQNMVIDLPRRPVWVNGDAIRLAQIFDNLITNAVKYTDDGGDIAVRLVPADDTVSVHIRDTGLGILPEMLPRVFELFVQDARSVDRSRGGLGVGLSLVRHLVELHKGSIEAASAGAGKGSEFVVRLPKLDVSLIPLPLREAPLPGGTGRILIVDDDVAAGESMAVLLRLYGYEVERATDLAAAMRSAESFGPQVVLMDIAMTPVDGYEMAGRLRSLPSMTGAAYIAVTGFGRSDDLQRTQQAGFLAHLVKPVDPLALDVLLHEAIDSHQR
jgi:two-component system CheB/CheR fusion protein